MGKLALFADQQLHLMQITPIVCPPLRLDTSIDWTTIDRRSQNFSLKDFTFRDSHNVL